MRIAIHKPSGRIIEMQSDAIEGALIKNAVNGGHAATDIEERVVSDVEYSALVMAQPKDPIQAITEIEVKNPITHRALRELILTIGEVFPAGKNTVFYQRVLSTEQAIQAERAKL